MLFRKRKNTHMYGDYSYTVSSYGMRPTKPRVSIICAAYNAEKTIGKAIESTFSHHSFEDIELIIVDDCSTDRTRRVVKKASRSNPFITLVSLNKNSGSPSTPRNIGIKIATGTYVGFLDADDWIDPKGIEKLANILDETKDDYAVGRTVKVTESSIGIIGEWQCNMERRSVNPFDIPYFFYHMGPVARLLRADLIRDNGITFPNMKFGEDKYFLFRFLSVANAVSTTTDTVYFANRQKANSNSLTHVTSMLEKRKCDLYILRMVSAWDLPSSKKLILVRRLFEYDFIRSFNTKTFINAKNKHEYIDIFSEACRVVKSANIDPSDLLTEPLYVAAYDLFSKNRIQEMIDLFSWNKLNHNKKIKYKNGTAYYLTPIHMESSRYLTVSILLKVETTKILLADNSLTIDFTSYGEKAATITTVLIRDRKNALNFIEIPVKEQKSGWTANLSLDALESLPKSRYFIAVRYDGHKTATLSAANQSAQAIANGKTFTICTNKSLRLELEIS